ncbi:MAG: hypothetical protein LBL74_00520 [Bacteroidales bacterium]|jgi:hypothetical protein|nr:hypothetical protein [Bacteroidales bacterium]
MKYRNILFWLLAVVITLGASVYQRASGPTNPKKAVVSINEQQYHLKFPRSITTDDRIVRLKINDSSAVATMYYRLYGTFSDYSALVFEHSSDGTMVTTLPSLKALQKIEYYIVINDSSLFEDQPLVLRYKDSVPSLLLIVHILLMFASMLFASYGFIMAFAKSEKVKKYLLLTIYTLVGGGFLFGALVQKYAFGVYWSGFPFGSDVTDNKTLIALIALLLALPFGKKPFFRYVAMVSFAVMFLVFCIPHSI